MMADYPKQLRERITKFREQKGVSESRMSRELGQKQMLSAADIFWKNAAFHGSIFQDIWISWDATDRILLGWRNWFDIYAWASGACKKYDKGRCRLLAHVGKIFERPGIYFKKSNLIFQKRPGKAQSAKPLEEHSSGACLSVCVYKGWGLNEKEPWKRLSQSDSEAVMRLVEEYQSSIKRIIVSVLKGQWPDAVDDILQDTYEEICRQLNLIEEQRIGAHMCVRLQPDWRFKRTEN